MTCYGKALIHVSQSHVDGTVVSQGDNDDSYPREHVDFIVFHVVRSIVGTCRRQKSELPFCVTMTSVWPLPYVRMWFTASSRPLTTSIVHSRPLYSVFRDFARGGPNVSCSASLGPEQIVTWRKKHPVYRVEILLTVTSYNKYDSRFGQEEGVAQFVTRLESSSTSGKLLTPPILALRDY